MKKIFFSLIVSFLAITVVVAQRTVSGTITDDNGDGLPGVNVVIKGTSTGTTTDLDGNYRLSVEDGAILVFSYVGFSTQEIEVSSRSVIDVTMGGLTELQEVVVTGVSVGTDTKKLGFSVGKIDGDKLSEVPASDPANALRGKVAGVKVVQNGGGPGSSPSIMLRSATSLSGSNAPLIIIDGIITHNSMQNVLSDINPDDIETIEVVKGAAAASLYGSLAGNGAINIITKRGSGEIGKTRITLRNEVGIDQLPKDRTPALANAHNYITDPDGTFPGGVKSGEADTRVDNPFPANFDIIDGMLEANPTYTNSISIASTQENTNFLVGFENFSQGGPFRDQDRFERRSARINVDHSPISDITLTSSMYYAFSSRPVYATSGQQNNIFYGLLVTEPDTDPGTVPTTSMYDTNTNADHPLYMIRNYNNFVERNRFLGSFGVEYQVADWWTVKADYSLDLLESEGNQIIEKGLLRPDAVDEPGTFNRRSRLFRKQFYNVSSIFSKQFGDIKATLAYRFQFEDDGREGTTILAGSFSAVGVPQLGNTTPSTWNIATFQEDIKSTRNVFNLVLDYQDKFIFDGVISRDGSSLFGSEERFQTYYRLSGAYRLTQDFTLPGIQELKVRGSYGITGDRPPFEARFETFDVSAAGISPGILGNENLKPADVSELELGLNASFLDRMRFEFSYATGEAKDQWLNVPLSPSVGFRSQFRNAGTIETTAWEVSLNVNLVQKSDWGVSVDLFADKAFAEVTSLDVPGFGINGNLAITGASGGLFRETAGEQAVPQGGTVNLFRIEEGQRLGVMYGNIIATSLDQLNVDENNLVTNAGLNLPLSDFSVNRDGYVVVTANEFTPNESVIFIEDANGIAVVGEIGDSNPDFNYAFGLNFFWKNLTFYALFDGQVGGSIYSGTEQNLVFNRRSAWTDQSGLPDAERKYNEYFQSAYNFNNPSSHFVQDADYLKFREVSLSYRFTPNFFQNLGGIGNVIQSAKLSFIGRNLLVFSDYNGFDPEVATANSAPIFRYDEYSYPQFRSFTVGLEVNF